MFDLTGADLTRDAPFSRLTGEEKLTLSQLAGQRVGAACDEIAASLGVLGSIAGTPLERLLFGAELETAIKALLFGPDAPLAYATNAVKLGRTAHSKASFTAEIALAGCTWEQDPLVAIGRNFPIRTTVGPWLTVAKLGQSHLTRLAAGDGQSRFFAFGMFPCVRTQRLAAIASALVTADRLAFTGISGFGHRIWTMLAFPGLTWALGIWAARRFTTGKPHQAKAEQPQRPTPRFRYQAGHRPLVLSH